MIPIVSLITDMVSTMSKVLYRYNLSDKRFVKDSFINVTNTLLTHWFLIKSLVVGYMFVMVANIMQTVRPRLLTF